MKALRRNTRGGAAIEFAVILPVFITFMLGIIEFSQAYFDDQTLQHAVESAGRMILTTKGVSQSQLSQAVFAKLGAIDSSTVVVTYNTTVVNGVTLGHLSATMTKTYTVPFVDTFHITDTADTYMVPAP